MPINAKKCEDADPMCPHCHGACGEKATRILYRVDMPDESGTKLCAPCSADAMKAGIFIDWKARRGIYS